MLNTRFARRIAERRYDADYWTGRMVSFLIRTRGWDEKQVAEWLDSAIGAKLADALLRASAESYGIGRLSKILGCAVRQVS